MIFGFWQECPEPQLEPTPAELPADYLRVSRKAMAADFLVCTNAGQYANAVDAGLEALDEVTRLEKQLSYFDEESEITRLNRWAGRGAFTPSSEVYALLKQCDTLFLQTEGAFDVTATPLCDVWGFLRRQGTVPDENARLAALARVGSDKISWDDANASLTLPEGMVISLGSIGKGYALDRAADVLEDFGIENFLLHGGSSSVITRGARRGRSDWLVGLHHPLRPGERLMEIPLANRALGTSGSAAQFFWHQGKRYGHILDPRTGFPAEGILSVTVLAPTATEADALATAFYVMGVERTRSFCDSRPDLGVLFVLPAGGQPSGVEIVKFGRIVC